MIKKLIFLLSSFLFIAGLVKFGYQNADIVHHWDGKNYYKGYIEVYQFGNGFLAYDYFGKSTEILFPVLYLILAIMPKINSPEGLLILHNFLFSILYVLLMRVLLTRKIINLSCVIILLGFCPPGIALQLGRQAIAFPIILIMVVYFYNYKKSFLIVPLTSIFSHLMSLFTSLYFLIFFRNIGKNFFILLLPILLFVIVFYFIPLEKLGEMFPSYKNYFNLGQHFFIKTPLINILIITYVILIFLFHICLTMKINPRYLLVGLLIIIVLGLYSFPISRVFFGYYFFGILLFINTYFKNIKGMKILNYTMGLILLSSKLLI